MINLDKIIMDFISLNWLSMTLAYIFANGISKITPFTWDEKVIHIFSDMLERLRPSGKLPNGNGYEKPPDIPAPPVG